MKYLVAAAALCLAVPAFAHDKPVYDKGKACEHTMVAAEQYAQSQVEANPDLEFVRFSPADSKRILNWLNKQPPLEIQYHDDTVGALIDKPNNQVLVAFSTNGCVDWAKAIPYPIYLQTLRDAGVDGA